MTNDKVLSPMKIVENILKSYNLSRVESDNLHKPLSNEILKDLSDSGYLK